MGISGEQAFIVLNDRKMYGEMCHKLAVLVQKIIEIFPALEAVQPQKSGMQALCGLHWALDKAKSFLQQIVHSSKLYLAITSDSVILKFEKVKECLDQSLRRLESSVPESLAEQVALFVAELRVINFEADPLDQEAGNEIISLLQKEKEVPGFDAFTELDVFDQVALKLGITTCKAVVAEKKALRRLLDKARSEEDKKKELILQYLLHLLRKYSKLQTFATADDGSAPEVTSSCPPSPSEGCSEISTGGRESDFSSEFCFKRETGNCSKEEVLSGSSHFLIPPEEFRCPISLQLMSDPVIISSGQTYERVCIEKWFEENHDTCPKTQQKLEHLGVTPNYCVKGLITSWCERHSMPTPIPPSPPPPLVKDWQWDTFPESVPTKTTVSQWEGGTLPEKNETECTIANNKCQSVPSSLSVNGSLAAGDSNNFDGLDDVKAIRNLVGSLYSSSLDLQCRAAEEIRLLTKDNADARLYAGEVGSIPALVLFLNAAIKAGDEHSQQTACLALLNVAVNNNRNKAEIVTAGAIPLLLNLLASDIPLAIREAAVVVLLTASCLDENKPGIGSSGAVSFLVDHLETGSAQGVKDALTTLFNLSIFSGNQPLMVIAGTIPKLFHLVSLGDAELAEKCTAVLYNLAAVEEGRASIAETDGSISVLAEILDTGTQKGKEHAAAILLVICTNSLEHSQLVLREGVIPSLVMLSVSGSARGKDKAQKLLQHFREQRQKESTWQVSCPPEPTNGKATQYRSEKSFRKKTRSGSFAFFRRSKSLSFYNC